MAPNWMVHTHSVSFLIADILFSILYSNKLHLYVGVEHLLRDVKDTTISTLATEVLLLFLFLFFPEYC